MKMHFDYFNKTSKSYPTIKENESGRNPTLINQTKQLQARKLQLYLIINSLNLLRSHYKDVYVRRTAHIVQWVDEKKSIMQPLNKIALSSKV